MALTAINSEDRLVQQTFAAHLHDVLGWETVYAFNTETFGPNATLGRDSEQDAVLNCELRAAPTHLNEQLPPSAIEMAIDKLTRERSLAVARATQSGLLRLRSRRRAGGVA